MARPNIFITYPFPLGTATGGARMTREIASHLGQAGAEVTILPVSATHPTYFPRPTVSEESLGLEFDEELQRHHVSIVRVPQHPLHWMLDGLSVRKQVRALLDRRPDVVLSYYYEGAFIGPLLQGRGIPHGYISTWQSYAEHLGGRLRTVPKGTKDWFRRRIIGKPHRQAQVFFATSHFTKHELVEVVGVPEERVVVCPLGIAPHFFDIPRPSPGEIRNLLFVGRVIASKGTGQAIEALGTLARKGITDWNLRVVGQGNHEWANEQARLHGVADRVEILPPVDDEGLKREFERAHLAVLPSHYEAFGLCFAEAQAAGLPVVAYNAAAVPEIVEHEVTGLLAPPRDVAGLADCIAEALQDPARTYVMGLAGRARARRAYSWQLTASTILEGLERICAVGGSRDNGSPPAPAGS